MARVKIENATKEQEIDLWGSIYTVKPNTRSVKAALQELEDKYKAEDVALAEDDDIPDDTAVARIGEQWDVLFMPKGDAPPASEVLMGKWEADEASFSQIQEFDAKLAQQMLPPSLARLLPR